MRRLAALAILTLGCSSTEPEATPGLDGLWSMHWRREQWQPALVDGFLVLRGGEGEGWVDTLRGNRNFFDVTLKAGDGDTVALSFVGSGENSTTYDIEATRVGDSLEGALLWASKGNSQRDAFHASRREVARFDGFHTDTRLPMASDAASTGIDPDLLDALVLLGEASRSDALVVVSDGQLVAERYYGRPPTQMSSQSITKAVSSLSLAFLQEEGKITDVEAPLSRWFPEFGDDGRKEITLRHMLTHTTGLDSTLPALNAATDKVAFARNAPLLTAPGSGFVYNNRAMQLLSGIVQAEAGVPVRDYLESRLFVPLGITGRYSWHGDATGHTPTYGGLNIEPIDLAVLGAVLADDGVWQGKPVIPDRWTREMAKPAAVAAPEMGLAWFLVRHPETGEPYGYMHSGSQGQFLYVFPEADLVIVRMVTLKAAGWGDEQEMEFKGLQPLAERLALRKMANKP